MTDELTILPQRISPLGSTDDEVITRWLRGHTSPNTQAAYWTDIRAFLAMVGKPLREITVGDVQDFGDSLATFSLATARRRMAAVKSLMSLAHRAGYLPYNVGTFVQMPGTRNRLAERIMTEADLQHMLRREERPRNAALLRFLYGSGCRASEACALRWRDLTPRDHAGQVTLHGKGDKDRIVLLPEGLWKRIYGLRGNFGPDDPVFRSRKGTPLDRSQVFRIVKSAARRAGLSDAISPHFMRHAHASHALDRGAPISLVQATLGHASVATTGLYLHARPGDSSARYLNA